jgi:hypothetical protein
MEILTQPLTTKGPAKAFTGDVWVDLIHAGPQPSHSSRSRFMAHLADYEAPRTSTRH